MGFSESKDQSSQTWRHVEEAATVFDDPLATFYQDPDHTITERRYLTIGTSAKGRLIHIAFADRAGRIRIVQA